MAVHGTQIQLPVYDTVTVSPVAGAVVTVDPPVYLDRKLTTPVTSLTSTDSGVVSCYALPGVYTFDPIDAPFSCESPITITDSDGGPSTPPPTEVVSDVRSNDKGFLTVTTSGQAWNAAPKDQSTAIQSLIDTAWGAILKGPGARAITVDTGATHGTFKLRPGVKIQGAGPKTVLRAMPGQSAAVLDFALHDAFHNEVKSLRVDGNRTGGATARGISMTSSANDVYSLEIPHSDLTADFPPTPNPFGNFWLNATSVIEDVTVLHCGADYAVVFGTNQRALRVRGLYIEDATGAAVLLQSENVQEIVGIIAGVCADGIIVGYDSAATAEENTNQGSPSVTLTSCFSWYQGRVNAGPGNGYTVNTTYVNEGGFEAFGGPQLNGCVDGDCAGVGILALSAKNMQVRNHQSSGAGIACLQIGGAGAQGPVFGSTFDIAATLADNEFTTPVGVILDGAHTSPGYCKVRLSVDPWVGAAGSGWSTAPVVVRNGASLATNDIEVCFAGCDESWYDYGNVSGLVNYLNMAAGRVHLMNFTADGQIGPVSTQFGYRMRIGVNINPGGNHVTWDASYLNAPPIDPHAPGTYWFRNVATTSATPLWLYEGAPQPAPKTSQSLVLVGLPPAITYNSAVWSYTFGSGLNLGGQEYNLSGAINDGGAWPLDLSAGIWNLTVLVNQISVGGVVTIDISYDNGTSWTHLTDTDLYAAATAQTAVPILGVTVPSPGIALLRFRVLSKNASSAGYYISLSSVTAVRTA